MNNSLDEIKQEYKPYRVTKMKNVTILDSTKGSFVIKAKSNEKVKDAYNYLISRNFDYFPKLAGENRSDVNVFEYVDDIPMPKEQKASDLIDIVALLHNKTSYYKEITEDKYKEIYEGLNNNIIYTKNYYDMLYYKLIEEVIPSPSHYLLLRNMYKVFAALDFAHEELENWYEYVKLEKKQRVAFIHNNLEIDHFIRNSKGYLVSWEKAKIDSPILDLINFYQKEYMNLDFETLFIKYMRSYPLNKEEQKLLFIVLSIPPIIKLEGGEYVVVSKLREQLDYIFKTENLVQRLRVTNEDK